MLSLCGFIRNEAKPTFFSQHVRHCQDQACPFPQCCLMQAKLKHFDNCHKPTCLACASARVAWLFRHHLVSADMLAGFVQTQREMMRIVLAHGNQSTKYVQSRHAFNRVLIKLYVVWCNRHISLSLPNALAIGKGLKLTPDTKAVYRDWEGAVQRCTRTKKIM
ncbi:hypothetical protein BASA81_001984 [Batrachochytrium salamandrivorans]|nr:hypothetical protein BASA81_001984 [Batrachochytrium salamandrivorans]